MMCGILWADHVGGRLTDREKFSAERIEQFGQMAAMVTSIVGQDYVTNIGEIIDLFCLVRIDPPPFRCVSTRECPLTGCFFCLRN
jgi:hypothetical protein